MTDNNFLAFQYAAGLLDEEQKRAIDRNEEFEKALSEWHLRLTLLNSQAPLTEKSAQIIWQNVNAQIQQDLKSNKISIVSAAIEYWRYLLSGIGGLGLFISVILFNQSANAQLGWNVETDLSKQQISVSVTTHKHTNKNKVCTLWAAKDKKILLIGRMPEVGQKTFKISKQTSKILKGAQMIISNEYKEKTHFYQPTIIDYKGKWII
ncbi:MAG: hypothetical protein FXV80_03705 [Candidatus Thioglobus sp.]|nr:MAG: hypothetical protein FXV80_03705 [Candidatus Thioglobus sp.]